MKSEFLSQISGYLRRLFSGIPDSTSVWSLNLTHDGGTELFTTTQRAMMSGLSQDAEVGALLSFS